MNGKGDVSGVGWNRSYICMINSTTELSTTRANDSGMAKVMFPYIHVQVFSLSEDNNFTDGM